MSLRWGVKWDVRTPYSLACSSTRDCPLLLRGLGRQWERLLFLPRCCCVPGKMDAVGAAAGMAACACKVSRTVPYPA